MLTQPEYKDVEKAHKLLSYITEGKDLMQLPAPDENSGIRIMIGPENIAEELKDSGSGDCKLRPWEQYSGAYRRSRSDKNGLC